MAVIKWMRWTKLTPAAGTLTGGRSLISKAETEVETSRLRAVCSITISQYLKMRRAKLNTHTDTSGNLWARSPIGVTSRNGWNEISGASARCRSCCPTPMYGTQRGLLGLENSSFLMSALHIVDDQRERERTLDYIRGGVEMSRRDYAARSTRHLSYSNCNIEGLWLDDVLCLLKLLRNTDHDIFSFKQLPHSYNRLTSATVP